MPETPLVRRRLRATIASATRYGRTDRADAARTSLAVERAAEAIEAVTGNPSDGDVERLRRAVSELEAVREWAERGAASAPPLAPQTARAIADALRQGGDAA